ncbi:MAG: UbiA-like polyprenyltransferase [Chloroflexota bacterium]
MTTPQPQAAGFAPIPQKLRLILDSIRFEHTIFALPFAYLGMVLALPRTEGLAADGLPTFPQFLWITVAMASARTLAMAANRIIDRHQDAENPRTASRPLPTGRLKLWEMTAMSTVSLVVFFFAAAQLNTLALALAPVAAIVMVGYPYAKRFTWTSHFILGWADGIAPVGGWIAVTGSLSWEPVLLAFAVATWVGGFDIFYACQDYDFDVKWGLHSIPQKFGIPAALWWAKGMHILTVASLLALGPWLGLGFPYYIGWALAVVLLVYEHRLVSPTDLSRLNMAFFNVNGYIAVIVFGFTFASIYV